MEAGKRRLAGDTARATTGEVQDLRREARALSNTAATKFPIGFSPKFVAR
jgi:transposase